MLIGYLPLDSRPCNSIWPLELAEWCHHACLAPDPKIMDDFRTPAKYEDSASFITQAMEEVDALVVSIDHLCYGSLIASRIYNATKEEAAERLDLLRVLHEKYPNVPIYAYSIIMRSSLNTLASSDLSAYRTMTEYSYHNGLYEASGDKNELSLAIESRNKVPRKILDEYLITRDRNFSINLRCVELASEGVLASLLLLQEDSETYGFHKKEQDRLLSEIFRLGLKNAWLQNGADEAGCATIMRAILQEQPCEDKPKVRIAYLDETTKANFIGCFEDRPFQQNLDSYLSYLGIAICNDSDFVLALASPFNGVQYDKYTETVIQGQKAEDSCNMLHDWIEDLASKISNLVKTGKKAYLLDLTNANGGNIGLMKAVRKRIPLETLCGYSAWNTATNSLGSVLAQICSDLIAGKPNRNFLYERYLDDLLYQAVIRDKLIDYVRRQGNDEFNLQDRAMANDCLKLCYTKFFKEMNLFGSVPEYNVSLPWPRTFEVNARVKYYE